MDIHSNKAYLIFGGMGLGGSWDDQPLTKEQIAEDFKSIDAALESGYTFFDFANIYRLGKSEEVFGLYLNAHKGLREKLFIQSKVGIDKGKYNFSKDHIISEVNKILERLQTDYLDMLLLHRPDVLMKKEDIKDALDLLFDSKKIRAFGVSNMDEHQIKLLEHYTKRKVEVNQLQLSLHHSGFVDSQVTFNHGQAVNYNYPIGTIEYCIMHDISIQAWGPMDRGLYLNDEPSDDPHIIETKKLIKALAKEKNVSSSAIVLAWLLKHPAHIRPVVGTRKPKRIKESVSALHVDLSRDEWYKLFIVSRGLQLP